MDKQVVDLKEKIGDILTPKIMEELDIYIKASKNYYGITHDEKDVLTNEEFDRLESLLKSYNIPELTEFIVGSIMKKDSGMTKIDNVSDHEMISLFKIKYKSRSDVSEINKFFNRATRLFFYGCKFDGASLKIVWQHNDDGSSKVKLILSRGGLDITENFKNHPDILNTAKYKKPIIAGELLCKKSVFNEKYSIDGDNDYEYENPRNFVGGLIKNKNLEQHFIDDLDFVPCTDGTNPLPNNVWKEITTKGFYDLEKIIQFYKSNMFPYLCDGVVLAYIEDGKRQVKDNYPLNMVSVKFPTDTVRTTVTDFYYTQKKSGKLFPMARIEPVKFMGSTLTKAGCYNYEYLLKNGIGIGSTVEIEKSGDITPKIVKVITKSHNIPLPKVEHKRIGKHLYAINMEESNRQKFILAFNILDIDGIGDTLAEKIGEVLDYDIIEVFNKEHKPEICKVLGDGAKWNDFQEVYNITSMPLNTLIQLLQFDQVGPVIAEKVANILMKINVSTSNIPGDVINNVCKGDGFILIKETLTRMSKYNVQITKPIVKDETTLYFEMSDNPPGMTKTEFKKQFQKLYPNSVHSGLTKKNSDNSYLFVADLKSNKGKSNKARKYNIKMVLYSEALKGNLE